MFEIAGNRTGENRRGGREHNAASLVVLLIG